jgi:hypothetical protein
MSIMTTTPELVILLMMDYEREAEANRLARVAQRIRDCCRPSRFARLVSRVRRAPATR